MLKQEVNAQLTDHSSVTYEDKSLKVPTYDSFLFFLLSFFHILQLNDLIIIFQGLQFLAEAKESPGIEKSITSTKKIDHANYFGKKVSATKTRIHRSYPVGISVTDLLRPDMWFFGSLRL